MHGVCADIAFELYRVTLRGSVVEAGLPAAYVPVTASWTLLALGAATAWGARRARRQPRRAA